jgi:hypothetical protein
MRTLIALALLVGATLSANATDLLLAAMKDAQGQLSLHYQPSKDCVGFLREFKQHRRHGERVTLTFQVNSFTGEVIEVNCIHEDGSVESSDKKNETVYCALTGKTVPADRAKRECS